MEKEIYELRKSLNFSQEELASVMNVTHTTIHSWENGHSEPGDNRHIPLLEKLISNTDNKALLRKKLLLISSMTDLNALVVASGIKANNNKIEDLIKEEIDEAFEQETEVDTEVDDIWDLDSSDFNQAEYDRFT